MIFIHNNQEYELLLLTLGGSRLYNTHYNLGENKLNPSYKSDYDIRGVFLAHANTKLGLIGAADEIKDKLVLADIKDKLHLDIPNDSEMVLYEAKKFFNLALNNNPNILDLLFADPEYIYYTAPKFKPVMNKRKEFLSKKVIKSFTGFAHSQLKRIQGHNRWMESYPDIYQFLDFLRLELNKSITPRNTVDVFSHIDLYNQFPKNIIQHISNEIDELVDKGGLLTDNYPLLNESVYRNALEANQYILDSFSKYSKPNPLTYTKFIALNGNQINYDKLDDIPSIGLGCLDKLSKVKRSLHFWDKGYISTNKEILKYHCGFRKLSSTESITIYGIYYDPHASQKGLIQINNEFKVNPPTNLKGMFIGTLIFNKMEYEKEVKVLDNLFDWVIDRNKKRSDLEAKFGYDTKHAAHLIRLYLGAEQLLNTGDFSPTLTGDDLTVVRDVRDGEYSYQWLLDFVTKIKQDLTELESNSTLPAKANVNQINSLLLDLYTPSNVINCNQDYTI